MGEDSKGMTVPGCLRMPGCLPEGPRCLGVERGSSWQEERAEGRGLSTTRAYSCAEEDD